MKRTKSMTIINQEDDENVTADAGENVTGES